MRRLVTTLAGGVSGTATPVNIRPVLSVSPSLVRSGLLFSGILLQAAATSAAG